MSQFDDIVYTVRSIEGYSVFSNEAGDASLKLAARNENGQKVWIKLEGLSLGQLLDYTLADVQNS